MDILKIFISSTQNDLQDERNEAGRLIEELNYECLRAEIYVAPGLSPEDVCLKMARECDIYVGIYGGRYGTVPDGYEKSVTEMEYEEAKGNNRSKIMIYVKYLDSYEPGQERFLTKVQDFSSGYFRHGEFSDVDELAGQIRQDINAWVARKIKELSEKEIEVSALKEKVQYQRSIMEKYDIPEELR